MLGFVSRTVAPHLLQDYEWFRSQADPFSLNDEIASLRTLMIEVRENIEDSGVEKVMQFGDVVQGLIYTYFMEKDWDEEEASEFAEDCARLAVKAYTAVFGAKPRMTPKDALDIAKATELTSKVCERYKKMCDGLVLKVEYDKRMSDMLMKFVTNVVMKFLPMKDRKALAAACFEFLPNIRELEPAALAQYDDEDILDAEYEEEYEHA